MRKHGFSAILVFLFFCATPDEAESQELFRAMVSGDQEVPAVETEAMSTAYFRFFFNDRLLVGIRFNVASTASHQPRCPYSTRKRDKCRKSGMSSPDRRPIANCSRPVTLIVNGGSFQRQRLARLGHAGEQAACGNNVRVAVLALNHGRAVAGNGHAQHPADDRRSLGGLGLCLRLL